jgi:hypothetical protein
LPDFFCSVQVLTYILHIRVKGVNPRYEGPLNNIKLPDPQIKEENSSLCDLKSINMYLAKP